MEKHMHKTRVELSMILEIDIEATGEDDAGAAAECIADGIAIDMAHWYESTDTDHDVYIAAWGVSCTDVEPVDYEKGE